MYIYIIKGVPRQPEVAQGVPGRLRSRIFLTFRHYKGGKSSAKRTGRLYPRRDPWYSLSEAESTSGHMVLSGVPWKKSPVTPPGIESGTVRLVAQRLNHYDTPGPYIYEDTHTYAYIYLHTQTHIHTYIYIYICTLMYTKQRNVHFYIMAAYQYSISQIVERLRESDTKLRRQKNQFLLHCSQFQ